MALPRFAGFALVLILLVAAPAAPAVVVLQYHHVDDQTPAITSVTPERFRQHMDYLQRHDFEVVSLPALVALLRAQRPLPDRAVALTFDDGYISVYRHAFPLLRQKGWPFTVFVNPAAIDAGSGQLASWAQLREMAAAGAVVANHSDSHGHLIRRRPGEGRRDWEKRVGSDIDAAQTRIATQMGVAAKLFAYPYGEYDTQLARLLGRRGYAAFGQHSGPLGSGADLQALPRFPFGGHYGDLQDFATKVNSLALPVAGRQLLAEDGRPLADPVLPQDVGRPQLSITLAQPGDHRGVNCFASGQGRIEVRRTDEGFVAQAGKPLPVGRSRYNCTRASAQAGRFYWLSQLFIRKRADGSWYAEP